MYFLRLLLSAIAVLSLPAFILAQDSADGDGAPSCTFSCPEKDAQSWSLVKRPHAVGPNSYYSIFECVYSLPSTTQRLEHKCSYNKDAGHQALGTAGDNCPPQAIPCTTPSSSDTEGEPMTPPMFSNQDKDEVEPWVEEGRYLLYLSEHHP